MNEIYIDNYKGFMDTFIKLEDVNFFIGENSSGKTAVVDIISLLLNPHFILSVDFNNSIEDIKIVSHHLTVR